MGSRPTGWPASAPSGPTSPRPSSTRVAVDSADLALRLVAPLGWCFFVAGDETAGADLIEEALACAGPADPRLRSLALGGYAWLAASGPDLQRAQLAADEALQGLGTYDDPATECFVLCCAVMVQIFAGRVQDSWATAERAVDAAERSGDRWCRAIVTLVQGELYHQVGDTAVAERMLADAGDAFAALGDRFCHLICVTEAAEVAELRGEYDRAIRMFEEGLAGVEGGFSAGVLAIRTRLANLEILRGNLSLAEAMHREVLDHWHGSVGQWPQAMSLLGLATIARRRGDPAAAAVHLDAAWAMGRTQTVPLMRSIALVARGYTADQQGDASSALGLQVAALPVARRVGAVRAVANAVEGLAGALATTGGSATRSTPPRLLGLADAMRRRSAARCRPPSASTSTGPSAGPGRRWATRLLVRLRGRRRGGCPRGHGRPGDGRRHRRRGSRSTGLTRAGRAAPPRSRSAPGRSSRKALSPKGRRPGGTTMSNVLYRWGRSAARHPWRMLGAWLIVVLGVVALRSAVGGNPSDNFTIPGTEAQRGIDLLDERFEQRN